MSIKKKIFGLITAVALTVSAFPAVVNTNQQVSAAEDVSNTMEWGAVEIGGGGFVSGIVTGQKAMYARTDVGGAYRYDYENKEWVQLMAFVNEADRGFLSIDAMAIDPTDDNTIYLLAGCAYFSSERTAVFKSTDGGETFTQHDVTDLIKVHGNGYGRQCGEAIAVDPDNPDIIYCGGDTDGLIMSKDAGETWEYVDSFNDLGLFTNEIKWPTWTDTIEKTTVGSDYSSCNGIGTIAIQDGRVYVGVSDNTIGANVYVADVNGDNWEPLSEDLPTSAFPSRINKDADGNLLICYVGGLTFDGTGGGIYKYDIKADKITDISPTQNSFGGCVSLPDDSSTLLATTCGVWSGQQWSAEDWEKDRVAYGDWFYRSTDGGKTWESIYSGKKGDYYWNEETGEMTQDLVVSYMQDGGYDWIRYKAIHWCGAIVLDPTDENRMLVCSGNGVFACDNIWDSNPQIYFHPDGIEEVVALDMISIPGRNAFSAIGDYDGFEHADVNVPGKQHNPNMGSTCAIAYCPQNPDVMIRIAENQNDVAPGFYTLDGGETWTEMANTPGGKAAITQLEDGSYRFFKSAGSNDKSASVSYSDDFGQTWNTCTGIPSSYGSKPTNMLVEPDKPNVVYAYVTYYNESWFYSKTEPDFSDAHYTLCVSTDYGKTFTSTDIAMYDQCDSAGRIAYLGEDNLILGAGYYGMYNATNGGKTVTKLDSVFYCKTVGYGAPEKEGDVNTLYMYGKPQETDPEGIYRSQDGGETWALINKDKLYGGTGNGNFLVGDMNEFGKVYMSTVGCGIVYGALSDSPTPPVTSVTTTTASTTTTTTVTTIKPTESGSEIIVPSGVKATRYGDVNVDGDITVSDVVSLNMYLLNSENNPLKPEGMANADCVYDNLIGPSDSAMILNYVAMMVNESQLGPQE